MPHFRSLAAATVLGVSALSLAASPAFAATTTTTTTTKAAPAKVKMVKAQSVKAHHAVRTAKK